MPQSGARAARRGAAWSDRFRILGRHRTHWEVAMRFEVPAGSSLVFSGQDGELLAEPLTQPITRIVQTLPEL